MTDSIGLIGKKIGMTQVFKEDGVAVSVTAISAEKGVISQLKTREKDGYEAVQVAYGSSKRLNKAEKGHLKGLQPAPFLREFRTPVESVKIGDSVDLNIFKAGDIVDIIGFSKGHGFAGVVKRHHFRGGPKTHGQSDRHRAPGSIGSGTSPGRVLRGLRMAGHFGNVRTTVRNLEVVEVNEKRNMILVKGGIPGAKGNIMIIKKTNKKGK